MKNGILYLSLMMGMSLLWACNSGEQEAKEETTEHIAEEFDFAGVGMDDDNGVPRGLQVGEHAPGFVANDQNGEEVSLDQLLENGPVILFFYRGYWCPFCTRYLAELMDRKADIEEQGGQLVAVTPEGMTGVMRSVEMTGTDFPIISNPELDILENYQVEFDVTEAYEEKIITKLDANIAENNESDEAILPVPATYVIGQDGIIKYAYFNYNYRERAPIDEIVEAL